METTLDLDARERLLRSEIRKAVKDGWKVTAQDGVQASFARKAHMSVIFHTVMIFLTFGIWLVVVVWLLINREDDTMTVFIDPNGKVVRT